MIENRIEIQEFTGTWDKAQCFGLQQLELAKEKIKWLRAKDQDAELRLAKVTVEPIEY